MPNLPHYFAGPTHCLDMCRSLIPYVFVLVVACTPPAQESAAPPVTQDTSRVTMPAPDPTGDWILVEFHDSIQAHKRIGAYRLPPPVWSALLLRVGPDPVDLYGSLRPHERASRASAGDALLELNDHATMTFVHDPGSDRILVHWTDDERPERHGTLHYRRLLANESFLTENLDQRLALRKNDHAYLLRTLFAGDYLPVGSAKTFSISDSGVISGHPSELARVQLP